MDNDEVAFFWSHCDIGMMFNYKQRDFKDISDVKELFERCKNSNLQLGNWTSEPTCYIYDKGWKFLTEHFGYESLFEINREVGWLNTENIELFKSDIADLMSERKRK